MMKAFSLILVAMLCCLCPAAEQPASAPETPATPQDKNLTHRDAANLLIDLLRDTEACLDSCKDAASVEAALPRLRELAERAQQIKSIQDKLPEPTTQDYMLDMAQLSAFNTIWKAVQEQIERLEKAQLISQEMRDILRIAPPAS